MNGYGNFVVAVFFWHMMHPATYLLLWAACLIFIQQQGLSVLALLAALSLGLAVLLARVRCWQMLRRTRWLLLTTAVLFVWGTPGEYLPALPGVSVEGMMLAAHQLLCLLLFLAWLCLLLEWMGNQRLIAALHALMAPLTVFGLNRDRAALRLLLVMDYLEQPAPAIGWRAWLRQGELPCPSPQAISLPQAHFGWRDGILLMIGLGLMVAAL